MIDSLRFSWDDSPRVTKCRVPELFVQEEFGLECVSAGHRGPMSVDQAPGAGEGWPKGPMTGDFSGIRGSLIYSAIM